MEASTDGRSFQRIGQLAGQGTSSARHDYHFTDANLARYAEAFVYYRLRQVDQDGTPSYSPVRVVAPAGSAAFEVQAAPNPFGELLTVHVRLLTAAAAKLVLRDALGRIAWQLQAALPTGASAVPLAVPVDLPAGMYLLTVQAAQQQRTVKVTHLLLTTLRFHS